MDFQLNEEQELFRCSVAEFVDKEVVPVAAKIDEEGRFPFTSCGFAMEYDVQRYSRDARLLLLGWRDFGDIAPYHQPANGVVSVGPHRS